MSDATHTRGPWVYTSESDREIKSANGTTLFCDTSYYPWCSNNEADWPLVAAAPELLAVARLLIRFCSARDGSLNGYEEWMLCFVEDGSTITEVVEKAIAAIAKAEGRAQ